MRGQLRWQFVFVLLSCCFLTVAVHAETVEKTFSHSLGIGASSTSWEHRIDLPASLAMKSEGFTQRGLSLSGKLLVEREELTPTYYYVKVRMAKPTLWIAKGSITVTLTTGSATGSQPPEAATDLHSRGGDYPEFSWQGLGKFTAISLLDRETGKTLWERVILGKCSCSLDEGGLTYGKRYIWGVRQATEQGKYSAEAQAAFRIGKKQAVCRDCRGTGYVTCKQCGGSGHIAAQGPNGQPVYKVCYHCNGTGRERCVWCHGTGYVYVAVVIEE